ncbi:DEAD/DEAH box helicase [Amycolatopsis nigrescens]|uniref:DEAD/DEAH box helicase n=1 Tax=Amycolatopsis nigrescens TaxID=381445 RepID=UPI000365CF02|nr:AAA domain-containing protein [Amycolatopsis nigrescens]
MPFRAVGLPGPIVLVPDSKLAALLGRQVRDHPTVPFGLEQLQADLNARLDGVPARLGKPWGDGQDWSLLLYGRTYVARLFVSRRRDAYTIASISPLRIRDHHDLSEGHLLLRPGGWLTVFETRQVPPGTDTYWPRLWADWQGLTTELDARRRSPAPDTAHLAFLDRLDRLIDASEQITMEAAASAGPFPYRAVKPVDDRLDGAHSIFQFELTDGRALSQGAFVRVHGDAAPRGQVTRLAGRFATIRFDRPVDGQHLIQQGELEMTPSRAVFGRQRDAVALLRDRPAGDNGLLSVLVDQRLRPLQPVPAEPAEALDADQLDAFRKAVAVDDLLLVLGPPGTGRTRLIGQIARASALARGRVLVTSKTDLAADRLLAKLPAELVSVRVGHPGEITPDGEPYRLERHAAALRTGILSATEQSLAAYEDIDVAGPWVGELGSRTERLNAALAEEVAARSSLAAARVAAGGEAQAAVDRLTAEIGKCAESLELSQSRVLQLTEQTGAARSRSERPVLGAVHRVQAGWWDRRLEAERENSIRLRANGTRKQAELEEARRRLEAVTQNEPSVQAATAALGEASRRVAVSVEAALTAAKAATVAISAVDQPPPVRTGIEGEAIAQDLATLRGWLQQRLPLLAVRAKLLADWRAEVSGASDKQLYPELIRYADVVATTGSGASSRPEMADAEFDLAIVQEAGRIGLAEAMVPLTRARRGVLVGDHQQPPPLQDSDVDRWGPSAEDGDLRGLMTRSAFELLATRLPESNLLRLNQQRRMPAAIADFVSGTFYQGKLRTERKPDSSAGTDPLFHSPLAFVDTSALPAEQRVERPGDAREPWRQRGYLNPAEAKLLIELAGFYHRRGETWALVVPYRAQVAWITKVLTGVLGDAQAVGLNVGTADSVHGERDVLLYGFTRSNPEGDIGLLKDPRRANAAFTRATRQLVLVGDLATLSAAKDPGFRAMAKSLHEYTKARGDLRGYGEVRDRLAELGAWTGDI